VTRAAWQIFDQRERIKILEWVEEVSKAKSSDPDLVDFEAMAPNGYALQAVMFLDRELEAGEYLLAGLRYADQSDTTWSAYFTRTEDENVFQTYLGLEFPAENGLTNEPNLIDGFLYETPFPELQESGIGGEIGQKYIVTDTA